MKKQTIKIFFVACCVFFSCFSVIVFANPDAVVNNNSVIQSTRFFSGDYEKTISGSNTTEVHYINCGAGLAAMYVVENGNGTMYFPYTDYLGSILTVTDQQGNIAAEQSFDAYGRNRNPADWNDYTAIPTVPAWLYRGYTMHEHLPQFVLINMNGRMYDPVVGRMLSPDNNLQSPDYSQNHNRYSYALNNPLKFVDLSGNIVSSDWFDTEFNTTSEFDREHFRYSGKSRGPFDASGQWIDMKKMSQQSRELFQFYLDERIMKKAAKIGILMKTFVFSANVGNEIYDYGQTIQKAISYNDRTWIESTGSTILYGDIGTNLLSSGEAPLKSIPLESFLLPSRLPFSTGSALVDYSLSFANPIGGMRGGSLGNPFKGKTLNEIENMFVTKGFTRKGSGSYINPKTNTRYWLDKGRMYKKGFEGPHIDIWYNNHPSFEKVKYFLDKSPKMYIRW